MEALAETLHTVDMAQMFRDAMRPRRVLPPEVLDRAAARAGELTGVPVVRPIVELLAELR